MTRSLDKVVGVFQAPDTAIRQTVLSGPSASGAPSIFPATSASLTFTTQNISTLTPLIVAAAVGFGSGGQVDAILSLSTNLIWTGLGASKTSWLFVNALTGATSSQALQPIYQFGGAISTAAGQFTFDWQAMTGYLGNGTTAVAAPLVCIGEVATSISGVTSSIAYAYRGIYQSGAVSFTTSTKVVFGHNIGVNIEFLDSRVYVANANTGPWLPDGMAYNTYAYPAVGVFGGVSRNQITFQGGTNGAFYDNGNSGAASSPGYVQMRVRRAW